MLPQLQLLGVPRFALDGRIVAVSWPRRSLSLLAYLFTARGPVARDTVASALWPDDDEEDARGNLRRNLNLLRGVLPPEIGRWISVDPGSIGFDHAAAQTDVVAFESLAAERGTYRDAASVYGGDFAAPLYDAWALAERERLRARFHTILSDLVSTSFSARRFDEALAFARRIVADEPFREDVLRRIIAIRYAMGDRPGALAEFERFRRALDREMSIEPMPETLALRDLVMRGDPLPSAPDAEVRVAQAEGTPVISLLPFGGRRSALGELAAAWDAAAQGNGNLVFLSGEAGIGKTRIVAEVLEHSVGAGARILRGTTASPEARPFEVVLSALAQAAPFLASVEIEPVWLGVLAPLVPELGARGTDVAGTPLPAEREALRTYESVARLLAALARARPVVVILEDLHWAGPGTLAAIGHVAKRIRGHRILIIATHRDGEGRAVEALRRELCTSGQARSVALAPLAAAEAYAVLAQLREPPSPADADLLVARSEGNPLFLTELLREYAQNNRVVGSAIAALVQARLEHAPARAQTLARLAALCGSTFDLDLLGAITGWDDGTLIDGVAELLKRQFIRSTATYERGSYAFTHALVREAVGEQTAPDEQRRTHHIVARALEARDSDAIYAAEIARHWQAAAEPERAARAYATAAHASLRAQARDEAAALATAGAELTADVRLRFDLISVRIEASLRHAPAQSLRVDAAELASLAAQLDETARFTAAKADYQIEELCGDRESRQRCCEALARFGDDPARPQRFAEIALIQAAHALYLDDIAAAIAAAERARDRYYEIGADIEALRAEIFIARISVQRDVPLQAGAGLGALEQRVIAAGNPQLAIEYWYARANVAHSYYDAQGMLAAVEHWHRAARAVGDRMMEGHAAWTSGTANAIIGRLTHAFRDTDRAIEIYRSIGAATSLASIQNNRASILITAGRVAEATALLESSLRTAQAMQRVDDTYFALSNLGVARLAAGAADEACELQLRAIELAKTLGSEAFEALAIGDLGAAQAERGDVEAGLTLLRRAAQINARLGRSATRAHDLARAARYDPEPRSAASDARTALAIVEAGGEAIKLGPEILWCCGLAFERAGDSAAAEYARRCGRDLLTRRAAVIEDDEDRRLYLALPQHAALLEPVAAP